MGKWNEEAAFALNNNLPPLKDEQNLVSNKQDHEFAEELADGGERNKRFDKPRYQKR